MGKNADTTPQGVEICSAFHPKAPGYITLGRSSDLFRAARLPVGILNSGKRMYLLFLKLTAAGTVPDFHRIPF
jgi:hypothetical protein